MLPADELVELNPHLLLGLLVGVGFEHAAGELASRAVFRFDGVIEADVTVNGGRDDFHCFTVYRRFPGWQILSRPT